MRLPPPGTDLSIDSGKGGAGVFEDFQDWEVYAIRDGEFLTVGFFRQTYPDEAVALLMDVVRLKFDVPATGWGAWSFSCVARHAGGQARHPLAFAVSPSGRPMRLAESWLSGGPAHAEQTPFNDDA